MQKAKIQKLCAALPGGDRMYKNLQKRFGRLTPDPFQRLPRHAGMLAKLAALGFDANGARLLEVGTGHMPVAPVGFYLAGAREVVTVDLHRRMDIDITAEMLRLLVARTEEVVTLYDGLVPADVLRERLAVVASGADNPLDLFHEMGIRYMAPGDAGKMPDRDESFDLHFSITCLEHIEPIVLQAILVEANRLLRPGGVAAHLIDPSDHFAHTDSSISRINFLKFGDSEWDRIAGNEFSYCNRLRAPELIAVFKRAGLPVVLADPTVDERSLAELKSGLTLSRRFDRFSAEDVCTTTLDVYAQK